MKDPLDQTQLPPSCKSSSRSPADRGHASFRALYLSTYPLLFPNRVTGSAEDSHSSLKHLPSCDQNINRVIKGIQSSFGSANGTFSSKEGIHAPFFMQASYPHGNHIAQPRAVNPDLSTNPSTSPHIPINPFLSSTPTPRPMTISLRLLSAAPAATLCGRSTFAFLYLTYY